MTRLNVNIDVIQKYNATKSDILTLAFYYKLKSLFTESNIYNYTKKRIAELVGLSQSQAAKYISKLKELNLVTIENGTLKVAPLSFLFKRNPYKVRTILIDSNDSVKSIAVKLKEKLIEENILNQNYIVKNKVKQIKREKSLSVLESKAINNKVEKDLNLSLNASARILNCSKSTASRFFDKTSNVEMIRRTKRVKRCTKQEFYYSPLNQVGIDFWYKGTHYKNLASRILLKRFADKVNYTVDNNIYSYKKGEKFTNVLWKMYDRSLFDIANQIKVEAKNARWFNSNDDFFSTSDVELNDWLIEVNEL